jgi:hypothetical protein
MNVSTGMSRSRHTSNSFSVCGSRPLAASRSITAESTADSTRKVSSEKSAWPGVSNMLITVSP